MQAVGPPVCEGEGRHYLFASVVSLPTLVQKDFESFKFQTEKGGKRILNVLFVAKASSY